MNRIVFTVAMGKPKYAEQALGLARSLKLVGDRTRRVVLTDIDHPSWGCNFDDVVRPAAGESAYLSKITALGRTEADQVLFIDSDSLVFSRLDRVWSSFAGSDIGVQGRNIRAGHWYGWMEEFLPKFGYEEMPRFNGGMIYYRRSVGIEHVFEEVRRVAADYDSTGLERFRGTVPDEPCLAIAMLRTGIGTILPETTDLMNTPVGAIGRVELDVMRNRCRFVKHAMCDMRVIEPTIFHAGKFVESALYWKQLRVLENLERIEQSREYGFMRISDKIRRSVERRVLKLAGKI